jgi:hypothetical protein
LKSIGGQPGVQGAEGSLNPHFPLETLVSSGGRMPSASYSVVTKPIGMFFG